MDIAGALLTAGAKFFPGARLNFAENLLRFRDDRPAIIFKAETSNQEEVISYKDLYDRVAKLSARLKEMGVVAGDRVAAYIPNIPEAIIAMLATTSLGAIWSSCSPDFGAQGVLDRFAQVYLFVSLQHSTCIYFNVLSHYDVCNYCSSHRRSCSLRMVTFTRGIALICSPS